MTKIGAYPAGKLHHRLHRIPLGEVYDRLEAQLASLLETQFLVVGERRS